MSAYLVNLKRTSQSFPERGSNDSRILGREREREREVTMGWESNERQEKEGKKAEWWYEDRKVSLDNMKRKRKRESERLEVRK